MYAQEAVKSAAIVGRAKKEAKITIFSLECVCVYISMMRRETSLLS
jgi:hypothetical protein